MENTQKENQYKIMIFGLLRCQYEILNISFENQEMLGQIVESLEIDTYDKLTLYNASIPKACVLASTNGIEGSSINKRTDLKSILEIVIKSPYTWPYFIAADENLQNHPCLVDIMMTSANAVNDNNAFYVWSAARNTEIAKSIYFSNLISTIQEASSDNEGTSAQYVYYLALYADMLANPLFPSIYHLIGTSKGYIQSKFAYDFIVRYKSSINENVLKMLDIITTTECPDRLNDMLGFYEINIKSEDASRILEIIEFYSKEEQADIVATLKNIMFEEMPFDEKYKQIMALKPVAMVRRDDNGNS